MEMNPKDTTIPLENWLWECEIKLRRNRASEGRPARQSWQAFRTAMIRGILISAFSTFDVCVGTAGPPFGVRLRDYTQIPESLYRAAATLCKEEM